METFITFKATVVCCWYLNGYAHELTCIVLFSDMMGPPISHGPAHLSSQAPTQHMYPAGGGGYTTPTQHQPDYQPHAHYDIPPAMHTPVPVNNTSPYGQEAYPQVIQSVTDYIFFCFFSSITPFPRGADVKVGVHQVSLGS